MKQDKRAAFSIPVKSVSFKLFDNKRHRACAIARLVELYTTHTTSLWQIERCLLQHVVGLRLGTPVDLSSSLPPAELDRALCNNLVLPSLIWKKISYWSEINPILQKWQSTNDTKCPECNRVIPIKMARHLRLEHTTCQCFWRCPVASFPSWFALEFEGKDHLEETHLFNEGHGCSFYECLRQFGLEWSGRRSFFDRVRYSGQALRMDIALARKSGQELQNDYVITDSPDFDELRLFFRVRELFDVYLNFPGRHSSWLPQGETGFAE